MTEELLRDTNGMRFHVKDGEDYAPLVTPSLAQDRNYINTIFCIIATSMSEHLYSALSSVRKYTSQPSFCFLWLNELEPSNFLIAGNKIPSPYCDAEFLATDNFGLPSARNAMVRFIREQKFRNLETIVFMDSDAKLSPSLVPVENFTNLEFREGNKKFGLMVHKGWDKDERSTTNLCGRNISYMGDREPILRGDGYFMAFDARLFTGKDPLTFDENLTFWSEDVDIGYQVTKQRGMSIGIIPEYLVSHQGHQDQKDNPKIWSPEEVNKAKQYIINKERTGGYDKLSRGS